MKLWQRDYHDVTLQPGHSWSTIALNRNRGGYISVLRNAAMGADGTKFALAAILECHESENVWSPLSYGIDNSNVK
jgi:hypothetical protein